MGKGSQHVAGHSANTGKLLNRRWLQFSLLSLLVLMLTLPPLIGHWLSGPDEAWEGSTATLSWRLTLNDDRFSLTITPTNGPGEEVVQGRFSRNGKSFMTLFVEKPGKNFYPYTCTASEPFGGYQVLLNRFSQPSSGMEFHFGCCDVDGADHRVIMHRQ